MAISKDKIKAAKQVPMSEVLNSLGVPSKNGAYYCPYHTEKTPSGRILDRKKSKYDIYLFTCFGCGVNKNNIELVMDIMGLNFPEAVQYVLELSSAIEPVEKKVQATKTAEENYMETLKAFKPHNARYRKGTKEMLEDHLKERRLNNAIKNLENNGYSIGITSYGKEKQITYKLNDFFIKRGLDGNKYIMGNIKVTPLKVNTSKTFVIVEGITDALAVAEMGYNALCLNGVGNTGLLTNLILEHEGLKEYHYIIGTDNDNAGLKAKDELTFFFTQHNVEWSDFQALRDNQQFKDIGELFAQTKI